MMFRKLTLITALAATLAFPAVALAGHGGGHGGGGRYWGGRWYAYGVGPCWRWYYGTWNWVCN